jgi:ethanolamine ammonia-lyase small subunit
VPDQAPSRTTTGPHPARLSLGDQSPALSTSNHLAFQLDHALARDAVHTPLDLPLLLEGLRARHLTPITVQSAASDRKTYLRRPDLGRTLHPTSIAQLQNAVILSEDARNFSPLQSARDLRIALILADGLSALALERHAIPLLDATLPLLPVPYSLLTVALATHARVALADHIGHLLHADLTILFIGERPGLSSPDSLGCYLTWNPRPGQTTDAERNCISNIRGDAGLSYSEAARRIVHYLAEAERLQTTGIALKDPPPSPLTLPSHI